MLVWMIGVHGDREEQIKAMKDYEFFSFIYEAEKQRTAKEVLCFIYLLNERHELQHLQEIRGVKTMLDTWCNEIKARATTL